MTYEVRCNRCEARAPLILYVIAGSLSVPGYWAHPDTWQKVDGDTHLCPKCKDRALEPDRYQIICPAIHECHNAVILPAWETEQGPRDGQQGRRGMTGERRPVEHFSPGEYIAEGLEGHGKTELDVVKDTSFTLERIHGIIYHDHGYTRDEAQALAEYFGTSADLWVNLLAAHIAGYMEELKQCIRKAE